jgi:hypothetical protein
MIFAMAQKDIMMIWPYFIFFVVMFIVLAISMSPHAESFGQGASGNYQWDYLLLNGAYGVAIIINLLIATSSFALYGKEIKRGTVQNLTLYPVSIVDLTTSRLLSTAIITLIGGMLVFFGAFMPFIITGAIPGSGLLVIFLMAYLITLFIIMVGAFAINILYYITRTAKISPSTSADLMFIPAILLTYTVVYNLGSILIQLSGNATPEDLINLMGTSQALSLLSPYHSGGMMLGGILGMSVHSYDAYIFLPLFILMIFGFILGRKVYPDIYIKE